MAYEQIGTFNWSSYNQLITHKLQMDELIYVLNPDDLPMLTGAGSNGRAILPRVPVSNREFKWMSENVPLPIGTINEALDSSETDVTVQNDQAVHFPVGSTVLVDDEAMVVTAINTTTHVLTVTRAALGTSAATHADDAEIRSIGTTLAEGNVGEGAYRGRDEHSNYTQIFSRKLNVTGTEQLIPKYGVPSELARQVVNVGQFLNTELEFACLYGIKHNTASTKIRGMGGLKSFLLAANTDSTNTWMTIERIQALQQLAYNEGGRFEMIMSRPENFGALNNIAGNERVQTVSIDDARRGRMTAQVVTTEFGPVELVRNRWMRAADAFCYKSEQVVLRPMRPMSLQQLAKTDDTDTFMMLGEYGLQVKGAEHMASFSALDSTATQPSSGLV
jgi:hypothetical protein